MHVLPVFATLVLAIGVFGAVAAAPASPPTPDGDTPIVPMVRGNASRTAEMPGPGPTEPPVEQWRFDPQADGASLLAPVMADGILYTIDSRSISNALYALDAVTGDERWRYPAEPAEVIVGMPAVTNRMVVVPVRVLEDKTYLASLEAETGVERWQVPLANELVPASSPAIVDGVAYVGTSDRHVTALDTADGGVRWRVSVGARVETDLAVAGGIVFVATDEPSMVALDASDGTERWRTTFADDDILLTPVVAEGLVLVLAIPQPTVFPEGMLHALEVGSGIERWRSNGDYGVSLEPAVAEGTVYVNAESTRTLERILVALDAQTGRERWQQTEAPTLTSPPSVAGDTIFVGSADGLLAVDASTGSTRWVVPATPVTTLPVVVDGAVYVTGPGTFIALADATTRP